MTKKKRMTLEELKLIASRGYIQLRRPSLYGGPDEGFRRRETVDSNDADTPPAKKSDD
jgi:hypothetical protein